MTKTSLSLFTALGMMGVPTALQSSTRPIPTYDAPPASRDDRVSDEELECLRRGPSSEVDPEEEFPAMPYGTLEEAIAQARDAAIEWQESDEIPSGLYRDLGGDGRVEAYVQPEPPSEATDTDEEFETSNAS